MKSPRKTGSFQKGDERILGDGKFVDKVFSQARETFERKYSLKAKGVDIKRIAQRVAEIIGMSTDEVWAFGKQSKTVFAQPFVLLGNQRIGNQADVFESEVWYFACGDKPFGQQGTSACDGTWL